jgi:hypothetical protein
MELPGVAPERAALALDLTLDLVADFEIVASFFDAVRRVGGPGDFLGAFSFSDEERKAAPLAADARVRRAYIMGELSE